MSQMKNPHLPNALALPRTGIEVPMNRRLRFTQRCLPAIMFAGMMICTPSLAQDAAALCEDIEKSRDEAIEEAQEKIEKEFETLQDARDKATTCMMEMSTMLGPLVALGSGSALGGMLNAIGDKVTDGICKEIQKQVQKTLRDLDAAERNLRRKAQKGLDDAIKNVPGINKLPTQDFVPNNPGITLPGNGNPVGDVDEAMKNLDDVYRKLMGQ